MIKKIFLFIIFLSIFGVSAFVFLQGRKPNPIELLKAEQEVYSLVLLDQRNAYSIDIDKFQIVEYTSSKELKGLIPEDSAEDKANFTSQIPGLEKETWNDYQEKNKVSYPIKNYLPFTTEVVLVNPADALINNGTKSEQFYWWVSFSRIGFNSSLTQAILLIEDCRGDSCYNSQIDSMYNQGYYALLQKEQGKWTIKSQSNGWLIESPAP